MADAEKVNLAQKLSLFDEYWSPKIVAELDDEDELFFVIEGRLGIEFRGREMLLEEGEMIVVPRGVEHRPVAEEEVHLMLFEPASTLNTGNIRNELTTETERI